MRSVRAFLSCCVVALLGLGGAAAFAQAPGELSPQQREHLWQHMTPDQRQQIWRNLSREQKGEVLRNLTPEQRQHLRDRMTERRMGPDGPRRLTPEERQRLRDQINEANRDFRNRPHGGGGPGHPMKGR